jgi:hypothetical protein
VAAVGYSTTSFFIGVSPALVSLLFDGMIVPMAGVMAFFAWITAGLLLAGSLITDH